ncbi:putative 2OG-Fe(II) oxygenase [Kangiella marina]|uniref:Fe2OG dioxygenase domain-containing protein n=1 Tax=Kangiella marina TaxID=1079178 RepID=A0ABP8IH30_9GAMM
MLGKIKIQPSFAVPIIEVMNEDCSNLNSKLKEFFLEKERKGESYKNKDEYVQKNKQVYESRFDLFSWNNKHVGELRDFCWASVYNVVGKLNDYSTEELSRLHIANSSWFHITRNGGYFGVHNHANSAWSGVYCVDPGDEGEQEEETNGVLSFISPNMATTSYIDKSCSNLKSEYSRGNLQLKLKPGQLILFPSWLLHEVKPYFGNKERITVAFNCWFKYAG